MVDGRPDRRSDAALVWRRWYKSPAWRHARLAQLEHQPLCERHLRLAAVVPASVVNHRIPHKGDWEMFVDPANHESLCKACHDGPVQSEERTGQLVGVDADGRPTSPNHPWNRVARPG